MTNVRQSIVPKRGMTCMHVVAQFGHSALMNTIFRVVDKTHTSKFLMMFDKCEHCFKPMNAALV